MISMAMSISGAFASATTDAAIATPIGPHVARKISLEAAQWRYHYREAQ